MTIRASDRYAVCQCPCCQRARARFAADPHQLALFADAAPLIAFVSPPGSGRSASAPPEGFAA